MWISVYDTNIRKKGPFGEGVFPLKWTKILAKVAKEKGVNIKGVLPHYGKTSSETGFKTYFYGPNIVDKNKEKEYAKSGKTDGLEFTRIYVGRANRVAKEEESKFGFLPSDHHNDSMWKIAKESLEKSSA